MKQELFVLPEDIAYAVERSAELEAEIRGLGVEFGVAFTESSETWHDNAPFEAVRDKQALLAAELATMRRVIAHSSLSVPKPKRGRVGYGSLVTLDNGKIYKIAGDWTPHAGHRVEDVIVVSAKSPLGQALFGKRAGDSASINARHAIIQAIS